MLVFKVKWTDGTISSAPKWLVSTMLKAGNKCKILDQFETVSSRVDEMKKELPEDFLPLRANYKPVSFIDTTHINALENKDKWLRYRKSGIGGSENATARGFGKYQSPLSLYWDKTDDPQYVPMDESKNWELLELGHIVEPWIRKVAGFVMKKEIVEVPKMFRHPLFDFMIVDLDGIVKEPDGSLAIFEAKNIQPMSNVLKPWKTGQMVPPHYIAQCRHAMAIMNLDVAYIVAKTGNTRNDLLIRVIYRDYEEEKRMILELNKFWSHVTSKTPPSIIETHSIDVFYKDIVNAKRKFKTVNLLPDQNDIFIKRYFSIQEKIKREKEDLKKDETEIKKLKALFIQQLVEDGQFFNKGFMKDYKTGNTYVVDIKEYEDKEKISSLDQENLKRDYPEIFDKYKSTTKRATTCSVRCMETANNA